ncbi:MAG: hypothetical protein ACI4EG_10545 [Fusicatenibacter sp.]
MKRNVTSVHKWNIVDTITSVRLASYATVAFKHHRFASLHTWLNKLTGVGVFLLPYIFAISTGRLWGEMTPLLDGDKYGVVRQEKRKGK